VKAGMWVLKTGEKEGFTLVAPTTFWDASENDIEEKTGGCGPGEIGDWFVPDTMYGESVFLACQIHDWMYGEGINQEDKLWADLVFGLNMRLLILSNSGGLDPLRLEREVKYFMAVYYGGASAFEKGETMKGEIT
jgi:hypothetical protein